MVLRKIFQVLSIIVHSEISSEITIQISLQLSILISFEMCLTLHISWQQVASIVYDSSNLKELLSMMSILVVIQLLLGKIFQFFVNNSCKWNFKWNYEWNFTSTFNTNFTWNVSHITHIFTKSASILFDSSNVKVLLSMMSILVVKQMVLRKISQFFVNNSSREISSEITIEVSLQLSILISLEMCLTLHISSQQVLLLCMIPPIWKNYYQWWVF